MTTHQNILKDVLAESGNDPKIANLILSYLYPCDLCRNHHLVDEIKQYYIKDCRCSAELGKCDHNYQCGNKDWMIKYMCYDCMKKVMLNHQHGKNGVLTFDEYIHSVRQDVVLKFDQLELAYDMGIMY